MDHISEQNIRKLSVGLANGLLQLVEAGIIPSSAILNIANRDYIVVGIEAAIRELVDALQD